MVESGELYSLVIELHLSYELRLGQSVKLHNLRLTLGRCIVAG